MPEKRKSITRARVDHPAKRKRISTSTKEAETEVVAAPSDVQLPLPTRISSSKPLPVLRTGFSLAPDELKTIAESGVVAASVERSRAHWLGDGLLEKYWTKPSKKKDQNELSNNPDKATMQRLGLCRIIIEPHTLEATLFTVRDASSITKPPPKQAKPQSLPGSGSALSTFNHGNASNSASPAPSLGSTTPFMSQSTSKLSSTGIKREVPLQPQPAKQSPQMPQPKPGQDPVIQMLAQRASSNAELKVLMQVVASGQANVQQLQIFQSHINELNAILQQQQQQQASGIPSSLTTAQTSAAAATQIPYQSPAPPSFRNQTPTFSTAPLHQLQASQAQASKSSSVPLAQASIIGIAVEFTAGNGNRYLLPRNSIYDYDPTLKQALLSFLAIQKGIVDGSGPYMANQDYYQPVTMRLASEQPRIFDAISRSLLPFEEVKKHFEDVTTKYTRADEVSLALQLPHVSDNAADTSTPSTPIAGKPADRRQSLLKQHMSGTPFRNSPAPERSPFQNQHCMYCFEQVVPPIVKLEDKTVCPSCAALRKKEIRSTSSILVRAGFGMRQAVAPRALML